MTTNIILAGVGGQGILTIAATLDTASLNNGLFFKQSEVHGMSQRGGAVQSHVRISDGQIYSDLIPMGEADMILGMEPMEALRYIPYLKKGGWIITEKNPFVNIDDYPEMEKVFSKIESFKHHLVIDASGIAKKLGTSKAGNMVLLGAASHFIPIKDRALKAAIKSLFQAKSDRMVQLNLNAYETGKQYVKEQTDVLK
jgi:indolepyruvate ferredoxin oxidoreductase beta subunit